MTMPLIPPFAITASYQKQQYGSGSIYTPAIPSIFSALVSPPATGVQAETDTATAATSAGYTGSSPTSCVQTISLTGAPTAGNFWLDWGGGVTTQLPYNTSAVGVQNALNALPAAVAAAGGVASVQTVTLTSATGGTFTLTSGVATSAIPYNAPASAVQSALNALAAITTAGGVTVAGQPGGPYVITFNNKGPQTAITAASSLTGTGAAVAVAQTQTGVAPVPPITVVGATGGPYTVTFGGNLANKPIALIGANDSFTPTTAAVSVVMTTPGEVGFSSSPTNYWAGNTALRNQIQQNDAMRNAYDSGSGNHF